MGDDDRKDQSRESAMFGDTTSLARLIAQVTHELRTPLHSMLSLANVLESEIDGKLNDEQKRQVQMITRNGGRMLGLLEELLALSRLGVQARTAEARAFDIAALARDIAERLQPVAEEKEIAFESDFEPLTRKLISDEGLVAEVLSNLLSNAIKYTPSGGRVSFLGESLEDGTARFQVVDSGLGIPLEKQGDVFDEFFQVGKNPNFGGVGLGLALVKASIEQLGGSLELKSEQGRGSLFTVVIPSQAEETPRIQVLVFDDDRSSQYAIEQCLKTAGYACRKVALDADGSDVQHGDLLLLSLDTVTRAGQDFTVWYRGLCEAHGDIPVIALSAVDSPKERAQSEELGADDFLTKPFNMDELLMRVQKQLRDKSE